MFHTFKNQFILSGRLVAQTALRIGDGQTYRSWGGDSPILVDHAGRPYIPGSSFKGALRAHIEGFIRTIIPDAAKDPSQPEYQQAYDQLIQDDKSLEDILQMSCWTSQMFGSPAFASRINVCDLTIEEKTWFDQTEIRRGMGIDRDTLTGVSQTAYNYEAIPPFTAFSMQLRAENMDDWMLGALLLGLKAFERGDILMGGYRSRGLGSVKLQMTDKRFFAYDGNANDLLEFLKKGASGKHVSDELEQQWLTAFREKITETLDTMRRNANYV